MMEKYRRQIILPGFGKEGQEKLFSAKVLIVGCGGLGSVVATYLVRAGVGTLGIVDSDKVDPTNLHRQIIYDVEDVGKKKADLVKVKFEKFNPEVKVIPYDLRFSRDNADEILKDYSIVADCSDNFETRYLVNDACLKSVRTLVHGAVFQYEGQVMVVKPGEGPCYRCLFADELPSQKIENGVLAPEVGIVGSIMAAEIIKLIIGIGQPLIGKIIMYNALDGTFRKINIKNNDQCFACCRILTK